MTKNPTESARMTKNDPSTRTADGDLLQLWNEGASVGTWRKVLATAEAASNVQHAQTARAMVDKLLENDPMLLQALRANAELVKRLTGQRWFVMRDAREHGATWDQIAGALGLKDAEAARAYYLDAIDRQERYSGDLHDASRARSVL